MKKPIITGLTAAMIAIGAIWISPAWTADDVRPNLPYTDAARVAEGAALYVDYCASCHGANLEGQQPGDVPAGVETLKKGGVASPEP
jgi:mono/diheme cytochrome c family protein